MNGRDDRPVSEMVGKALIDKALAGEVPGTVNGRLHSQLSEFRARLATAEPSAPRVRASRRPAWWGLGITVAAGIVVATMIGLSWRAQIGFAEVARAALEQPWIHVRRLRDGNVAGEAWYAATRGISASRWNGTIEYHDYRLDVYDSYNTQEEVLYRLPEFQKERVPYEPMSLAIMALLKEERTIERPLESLDFLGAEREKMKLLDQEMKKVTEDGRQWLDYRLTASYAGSNEPMRMFFRADAVTRLPAFCRLEGSPGGKPMTVETRFDYPDRGPTSIFDLGVPKTAQLVDRVPTGDLKRILQTLRAGRERMDDYRAVFVMEQDGLGEYPWWLDLPMIFYRKGNNFRADYTAGRTGDDDSFSKSPGQVDDLARFWHERVKSYQFYPQYVLHGSAQNLSTTYSSTTKSVTDADGSEHEEIASVHRSDSRAEPGESFPPEYSMRPEFACRPPFGIGNQHQQPELDMHPSEGPPGCILLKIEHTSKEGRINEKGVGLADENRFWLDPGRDYIVMRWDTIVRDKEGKEELHESDTVEELAQSPRGVWYATRIRRHCPQTEKANGKRIDQIYHLYVDFDVDLPDAFFDPPKAGRIH